VNLLWLLLKLSYSKVFIPAPTPPILVQSNPVQCQNTNNDVTFQAKSLCLSLFHAVSSIHSSVKQLLKYRKTGGVGVRHWPPMVGVTGSIPENTRPTSWFGTHIKLQVPSAGYHHLHYHPIIRDNRIHPMGAPTSEMDSYTLGRQADVQVTKMSSAQTLVPTNHYLNIYYYWNIFIASLHQKP
jgi:hypothetical protein